MHAYQPLRYIKGIGRGGASPQKWFLSQLTKGKGSCWQAGVRAKDLNAAGRGFPGGRLQAPVVVLELGASDSMPVNSEQHSGAQNLAAGTAGVSFQSP